MILTQINDIAICLMQRGVTVSECAKMLSMTRTNFSTVYAHMPTPRGSAPWRRVRDKLKKVYQIDYDRERGWYCMTDDDIKREAERQQDALNRMLRVGRYKRS